MFCKKKKKIKEKFNCYKVFIVNKIFNVVVINYWVISIIVECDIEGLRNVMFN